MVYVLTSCADSYRSWSSVNIFMFETVNIFWIIVTSFITVATTTAIVFKDLLFYLRKILYILNLCNITSNLCIAVVFILTYKQYF